MDIRLAAASDAPRLSAFVARQQADPFGHIGYLGSEPDSISEDLSGLKPLGWHGVMVAESGGEVVGLLGADWDSDPPRVWWHGPFAATDRWDEIADRLMAAGQAVLPPSVVEQELAPDERNTRVAAFARRHGFVGEEASVSLVRSLEVSAAGLLDEPEVKVRADGRDPVADASDGGGRVTVKPLTADDRAAVAVLHDRLFQGSHLTGARLADEDGRFVLVARAQELVGYVTAQRQSDGGGYIDFVGVAESARGRGTGAALVAAACRELRNGYGCPFVDLTVRESNEVARRLYRRCGFTEQRLLRPWRRGFTTH